MPMTVREALKLGRFSECEVVAGAEGLTRNVESITIMEDPDVTRWVRNNELLITSLYSLEEDNDASVLKLINQLTEAGASGLAIKPSNNIGSIPKAMIKEADKLSLPIIHVPEGVHFLDILNPVLHRIFSDKVVLQEDVDLATAALEDTLLGGSGMLAFMEKLEMILQNFVTVESDLTDFGYRMQESEFENLERDGILELYRARRPIEMVRKLDGRNVNCIVSPIIIEEKYRGNITVWDIDDALLSFDIAVLEKSTRMLSLELLKVTIEQDINMKHENDYLREILFSSDAGHKLFQDFGEIFKIKNDKEYFCVALSLDKNVYGSEALKTGDSNIYAFLKEEKQNLLVGKIKDIFCLIRPVKPGGEDKVESYCDQLMKRFPVKAFGIGEKATGFSGIKKSYSQAVYTLDFVNVEEESRQIIYYRELGAYILLDILKGRKELEEFYYLVFGRLLQDKNSEELFLTLKEYIKCDGRLKETSENLFIHINTLKYRIKKIESLTGNDLKASEGNFNLMLALKIHSILKTF